MNYDHLQHFEVKDIPTRISSTSLVGIGSTTYPLSYGNYCSVGRNHLLNVWAENLEHLQTKGKSLQGAQTMKALVAKVGGNAIVIDKRFPSHPVSFSRLTW